MRARLVAVLMILLGYGVLQSVWLPPDGFFAGDCAAKYLQARAVLANGPLRPWIEGPAIDAETALRWREPVLLSRGGHLVSQFSWLMPLLGAPFLGLLGLRGLYVIPAVAIGVIFLAASSMGRTLGQPAGGAWSGWCAVLATPLLFYGAELWEHAPAVALTAVATAILVKDERLTSRGAFFVALCLVGAFSLRAETFAVGPALLLARTLTFGRDTLIRDLRALLPGGVVAFGVLAVMNYVSYAHVMPAHVQEQVGGGVSSWALRRDAVQWLLLPPSHHLLFMAGLAVALAAAALRVPRVRLLAAHAGVLLMLAASFGPPLWRTFADGRPWLESFTPLSLAQTWPIAALLFLYPALRPLRGPERLLAVAAGSTLLITLAALPQTGGAQWSARFFLAVMPAGAALAVELGRKRGTQILAATAIVASIALQVYGLTLLRHHKRINAQITRSTASVTQPGDIIVSDVFWYPQVTVTLYPTRRLLFAPSSEVDVIAARAAQAGFRTMWVVAVTPLTGYTPPPALTGGFVQTSQREAGIGSVTFHQYVRRD